MTFQIINNFREDRRLLAYCIVHANPSTLFQLHFQELWILFAFCRDYIFSYPLDQHSFKARTWHQLQCRAEYDADFYRIEPEEFEE